MTDLLSEAERLLDETPAGTASAWPRAAALLGRQSLEGELTRFWWRHAPGVERVPMRAQLACLRFYAPPDVGSDVSFTWHALSRATHHHPYDLDPTREELASLLAATRRLVALLRASSGRPAAAERRT